ncbi:MAG: hypothetical protein ABJZ55_14715 [Fuerstiella sp.]
MSFESNCKDLMACLETKNVGSSAAGEDKCFRLKNRPKSTAVVNLVVVCCVLSFGLLSFGLLGCGQAEDSSRSSTTLTDDALLVTTERGPLVATVEVTPKQPRLSDILTVTLTVTATDQIEVKMPAFRSAFKELIVRDFQDPLPTTASNQRTFKQIYQLEPTAAGELIIPTFTIKCSDAVIQQQSSSQFEDDFGELVTDELKVTVETIIDVNSLSLDLLKPAAAPIALSEPVQPFPWLRWVVAAASLLTGVVVWWVRSKQVRAEDKPSANEIAQQELDQLVSDKSARADLRTFYVRLTGVVRRYIEAVTGVKAAEQTTEEFLSEMGDRRLFSDSSNQRLQEFLEASDLIKFAGQTPDAEAVEESIRAARQFIQLPPVDESVTPAADGPDSSH